MSQSGAPKAPASAREASMTRDNDIRVSPNDNAPTEISPLLNVPETIIQDDGAQEDAVPYKNIDDRRFKWLFGCNLMAFVLAYFDNTLVASSHPVITSYFNASNLAPWLSTVFFLSATITTPLYGRISDTVGRRPVWLFAMILFGSATAWSALAQSIGSFIAARAACGAGFAGIITLSNILLADVIKIEYRGLYQSYLNLAYGIGNSLGAALGSFLCDRLGWRTAFGIELPCTAVLFALAYFSVPDDLGPNLVAKGGGTLNAFKSFDFAGAVALTVTTSALILGLNLGGNVLSWGHPVVIVALCTFAVTFCLLLFIERRAAMPVLPLRFLSVRPLGTLIWSNFVGSIVTSTFLFNFPLLLQAVWQTSPTESGLWLLGPLVGVSASSFFTGVYIKRTKRLKPAMVVGALLYLVGSVTVSGLTLPRVSKWTIVLLNPYTSIAQGFHFPATTVATLALSSTADQAVVTTTLGLLRSLGSIVGVSTSSWIFQNTLLVTLDRQVTGAPLVKQRIVDAARKSVRSIPSLDQEHRAQVVMAYSQALRITFLSGAIFAAIVMCLIWPTKIPTLGVAQSKAVDDPTNEETPNTRVS